MKFIRVRGRVVPIKDKNELLKKRLVTAAVAAPAIIAAPYSSVKTIESVVHLNQAGQSFKKAVLAHRFGMFDDYEVFKAAARKSAFAYKAASKAALKSSLVVGASLGALATLGYMRRKKTHAK